ncbi:MAG: ABC transporter ATP-binding protein [Arenicellales bacterium]|jgi:branched-chain amino acid transport system ATP-binding protein
MKLSIENLNSFYGSVQVLRELTLHVNTGEVLCLLGRNGAGKTTILKSIMGLVEHNGSIMLGDCEISGLGAHEIPRKGIGYVPQGRRLFAELTVKENLQIGMLIKGEDSHSLDRIFKLFPVLKERLKQESGTLSGGEQQMLAMARALCLQPGVLLLDEPTEGLMPSMIASIRDVVLKLREQGVGILLVEQRIDAVLPVANRVAFIENGYVKAEMERDELANEPDLMRHYVGI